VSSEVLNAVTFVSGRPTRCALHSTTETFISFCRRSLQKYTRYFASLLRILQDLLQMNRKPDFVSIGFEFFCESYFKQPLMMLSLFRRLPWRSHRCCQNFADGCFLALLFSLKIEQTAYLSIAPEKVKLLWPVGKSIAKMCTVLIQIWSKTDISKPNSIYSCVFSSNCYGTDGLKRSIYECDDIIFSFCEPEVSNMGL